MWILVWNTWRATTETGYALSDKTCLIRLSILITCLKIWRSYGFITPLGVKGLMASANYLGKKKKKITEVGSYANALKTWVVFFTRLLFDKTR